MATTRDLPGTEQSFVLDAKGVSAVLLGLRSARASLLRQCTKYAVDNPVRQALNDEMRHFDALITKFGG